MSKRMKVSVLPGLFKEGAEVLRQEAGVDVLPHLGELQRDVGVQPLPPDGLQDP